MNNRSWALFNMRKFRRTEYTDSEKKALEEIIENCFDESIPLSEVEELIKPQFKVNGLVAVDEINPTIPPPRLDIAIPTMKIGIRVNGLIHETRKNIMKDEDQKVVLEGNGWTLIDIDWDDREDLWQ